MSSFRAAALPPVICLVAAVAALTQMGTRTTEGPVAAVFPPWWHAADVFTAAGAAGRIVRFGAVRFVVIVAPENMEITGNLGMAERLRAAGALLVVDPTVTGGCSSASASISG